MSDYADWVARGRKAAPTAPSVLPPVMAPDKAAAAITAGDATGGPPVVDEAAQRFALAAEEARKRDLALKAAPKAAAWYGDTQNAAVSNDDVEALTWWERDGERLIFNPNDHRPSTEGWRGVLGTVFGGGERAAVGTRDYVTDPARVLADIRSTPGMLAQGQEDVNFANLAFKVASGKASQIEQVEFEYQRTRRRLGMGQRQAVGPAGLVAQQLPQFGAQAQEAGPYVIVGGALGALVTAPVGGEGVVPGVAAGAAISGAVAGAEVGVVAGGLKASYKQNFGQAYAEFLDITDDKGLPIGPDAARAAAFVFAAPAAVLDAAGFRGIFKGVTGDIGRAEALKLLLARPGMAKRLAGVGARWAKASTLEGTTEAAQEALQILTGETLKAEQEAETPGRSFERITAQAAVDRVGQAGVVGALVGGAITAPSTAISAAAEVQRAQAVKTQQRFFEAMADTVNNSALKKRLPKKFREAVDAATAEGPLAAVHVDAEALVEYLQSNETSVAAFAEQTGVAEADISRALQQGGKIEIPMGAWAGTIVGTPMDEAIRDHITLSPDGMTPAQARDFEANAPELFDQITAEREAATATQAQTDAQEQLVRSAIRGELAKDTGFGPRELDTLTETQLATYRQLAARTGWSMEKVLAEYPPAVVASAYARPETVTARPVAAAPAAISGILSATSVQHGVDLGYLTALARRESSFKPNAGAATSSARGLYQFIESTWAATVMDGGLEGYPEAAAVAATIQFNKNGRAINVTPEQRAVLDLRLDAKASGEAVARLTAANAESLRKALRREPSAAELYMAHFAGAGGAAQLLKADDSALAAGILPAAAKSNPTIFYEGKGAGRRPRTVAEVKAELSKDFTGEAVLAGGPQAGQVEAPTPTFDDDPAAAIRGIFADGPDGGVTFDQMAGPTARTADLASMRTAIDLEGKGRKPEDIWARTGWMRGEDSLWRFEIDDSAARLTSAAEMLLADEASRSESDPKAPPLVLGDVYDNEKLYAAYPGLRNVTVDTDLPAGALGSFNPSGRVSLNPDGGRAELLDTLNHEIQHAIQEVEGFAKGAAPTETGLRQQGYTDALIENISRARTLVDPVNSPGVTVLTPEGLRAAIMDTYRRASGEIEARQTQARANLSPEERAMRFPALDRDVPVGQGIVAGARPSPWAGPVFNQSDSPIYYSALERAVRGNTTTRASAEQWIATLSKTPGVKREELEWSGVIDWLNMQDGPITQTELLAFVEANGVRVEEVVLGDSSAVNQASPYYGGPVIAAVRSARSREEAETMLANDGDAYRWLKGRFPDLIGEDDTYNDDWAEDVAADLFGGDGEWSGTQFSDWKLPGADDSYREVLLTLPKIMGPSTHWDTPNVIAHARLTERRDADGGKVLFIEEVQSDWHQKGRDEGYQNQISDDAYADIMDASTKAERDYRSAKLAVREFALQYPDELEVEALAAGYGQFSELHAVPQAEIAARIARRYPEGRALADAQSTAALKDREARIALSAAKRGIPDAPFKTTWPALVMRRMIRWGVDHGYQKVAWTTGTQQIDRYNLAQAVGHLNVLMEDDGRARVHAGNGHINLWEALGKEQTPGGGVRLTRPEAEEAFGAAIAQRIFEPVSEPGPDSYRKLEGVDLQVGGEGMRAFYDRNLVNITNDIIKRYGVKVERETLVIDYMGRRADVELLASLGKEPLPTPTNPSFTITPELAAAAKGGFTLFQTQHQDETEGSTPRGSIRFEDRAAGQRLGMGRRALISLTTSRNITTPMHEFGHWYLEVLQNLALRDDVGGLFSEDMAALRDWFNIPPDVEIGVREHEMFAEGFEQYLYDGKAPSLRLTTAFENFKAWFMHIYRRLRAVRDDITPEVRAVFDRMLATEDEIAEARAAVSGGPLLNDPSTQGLSPALAEAYTAVQARAHAEASAEADARVLASVERQKQQWFKDRRAQVEAEVDTEIAARPVYRAFEWLAHGAWLHEEPPEGLQPFKLSKADIEADYGAGAVEELPRGQGRVYQVEGGVHPDVAADVFGFESGGELLRALADSPKRREAVKAETDARMAEEFPDPMTDGTLPDVAMDAIHNRSAQRVLELELQALTGRPAMKGLTEGARRDTLERTVKDLRKPDKHLIAERQAANAAQRAFRKGDLTEAAKQKLRQLVAHVTWRATREANDEIERSLEFLKKFKRPGVRKKLDGGFIEQIDALLSQYDLTQASGAELARRESLIEFVARMDAEAMPHNIDPRVLERAGRQNYLTLTLEELRGLTDTIRSIDRLGRLTKEFLDGKKRADREEIVEEMLAQTFDMKKVFDIYDLTTRGKKRFLHGLDASMAKAEFLTDELDRHQGVKGVFHRILIAPASHAQAREGDLHATVGRALRAHFLAIPEAVRKRWDAHLSPPELATQFPLKMSRGQLVAIALNMGSVSSREKLLGGYGWDESAVLEVLNRELAAEEWTFVQGVWDTLETLWPEIEAAERRLTGSAPERVEPAALETPHGTLRGGYYPVKYDTMLDERIAQVEAKEANDMFGGLIRTAATPRGHTMSRTGYVGPVLLSVESVLFGHVNKVIKRITYGEFAISARQFLIDGRVSQTIREKLGPEYYDLLMPWLQRQANDGLTPDAVLAPLDAAMRHARSGVTIMGLGWRATTALAQVAGLFPAAHEVGAASLSAAIAEVAIHPVATRDFALGRSDELRQRGENLDRDLREMMKQMSGKDGVLDKVRESAFYHIAFMDRYVVALPTWLAAYRNAISAGEIEENAIALGDKAVRLSQGAGGPKDLAHIQVASEGYKMLTLFFSYFNTLYNQQRKAGRHVERGEFGPALSIVLYWMIAGPLASALLTGDWPDDDERDGLGWAAWAGRRVGFGAFASIPVLRDIASVAQRKSEGKFANYTVTPLARLYETVETVIKDVADTASGADERDQKVRHGVDTAGYFLRLPLGQVTATAQYVHDLITGEQNPESAGDLWRGITKGPQRDQG